MVESVKEWSYHSIIIPYILQSNSLLDMGTGGGEFLSILPFPTKTIATEYYAPNIPIAKKRLEPKGVSVIPIEDENNLPFADEQFDLIINRHEYFNPAEVARILQPQSYFITQQVGNENDIAINHKLGAPNPEDYDPNWTVDHLAKQLSENGMIIKTKRSLTYTTRIFDIGALVYHLKAIPWQIPNFSVDFYKDKLFELHQEIQTKGYFDIESQRYLIIGQK
ncbi:class I SAM-dependent methyltransferase [Promethearchaeum syntrophicum]|uniref:Class I SAM-dependent methyltransferase n=1 Tax=Promethearchaeum syntrophicum TaxID=2594042 RepID=A0A5B9DCB3_9ARCH|nr:class I SAM-dependent methyltransferase [Candidatus Prometheoarchaeum syntrophicum]